MGLALGSSSSVDIDTVSSRKSLHVDVHDKVVPSRAASQAGILPWCTSACVSSGSMEGVAQQQV